MPQADSHQSNTRPGSQEMGFYEHLDELRVRLIRCAWVFTAGFALCYFASDHLLLVLPFLFDEASTLEGTRKLAERL